MTPIIRQAGPADVDQIVEIGSKFHAYSTHADIPYDREAFAEFIETVLLRIGAVFLTDDGMCGGVLSPLYFNPSCVVASELFWWAPTPGTGTPLREAFEEWAKDNGAIKSAFTAMVDEKAHVVDRIYQRAGYRRTESSYVKGLH